MLSNRSHPLCPQRMPLPDMSPVVIFKCKATGLVQDCMAHKACLVTNLLLVFRTT